MMRGAMRGWGLGAGGQEYASAKTLTPTLSRHRERECNRRSRMREGGAHPAPATSDHPPPATRDPRPATRHPLPATH
jgi:hypothetical protein